MLNSRTTAVYIVDDDDVMRSLIRELVESVRLSAEEFSGAEDFLARHNPSRQGCLVTDVRMPGMTGLELQEVLAARQSLLPVILVTAHADVPMVVRAMKSNVIDVIEKPFAHQDLLNKVQRAAQVAEERWQSDSARAALAARVASLTPREREVMDLVVLGLANKQIARQLDLSEKTVEAHRSHLMKKLGARSLAELVRLGVAADPESLLGVTTAPLTRRS